MAGEVVVGEKILNTFETLRLSILRSMKLGIENTWRTKKTMRNLDRVVRDRF